MSKAVFLDRDGTIIKDMVYLNDPEKILVFPGAYEAVTLLNRAGFKVIVATNQSGIARGLVQPENFVKITQRLAEDFARHGAEISDTFFCPHPVDGGCLCRKPNPGMLEDAAKKHSLDLTKSWMVGDRMSDVLAGDAAGCAGGVLLQNVDLMPFDQAGPHPKHVAESLLKAAELILDQAKI